MESKTIIILILLCSVIFHSGCHIKRNFSAHHQFYIESCTLQTILNNNTILREDNDAICGENNGIKIDSTYYYHYYHHSFQDERFVIKPRISIASLHFCDTTAGEVRITEYNKNEMLMKEYKYTFLIQRILINATNVVLPPIYKISFTNDKDNLTLHKNLFDNNWFLAVHSKNRIQLIHHTTKKENEIYFLENNL